jgi:ribosomal protein S25
MELALALNSRFSSRSQVQQIAQIVLRELEYESVVLLLSRLRLGSVF